MFLLAHNDLLYRLKILYYFGAFFYCDNPWCWLLCLSGHNSTTSTMKWTRWQQIDVIAAVSSVTLPRFIIYNNIWRILFCEKMTLSHFLENCFTKYHCYQYKYDMLYSFRVCLKLNAVYAGFIWQSSRFHLCIEYNIFNNRYTASFYTSTTLGFVYYQYFTLGKVTFHCILRHYLERFMSNMINCNTHRGNKVMHIRYFGYLIESVFAFRQHNKYKTL